MSKKEKPLNYEPTKRGIYAWNALRAGDFLVFVKTLKDCHRFVYLPGPSDFYMTLDDFTDCMKKRVLELVEQLPKDVYEETISLSCPQK